MKFSNNVWALVLAAGEGSRVHALTMNERGEHVPKQFCRFGTGESLLRGALNRAEQLVSPEKIITVVAPHHQKWWRRELAQLPQSNTIVQPLNRGTAPGILLPLLEIMQRDPDARVLILPSDHFVEAEDSLHQSLDQTIDAAFWREEQVVLLGISPEVADSQYGWIVPDELEWDKIHPLPVKGFVEKPPQEQAQSLMNQGALWNSFMLVATGRLLLYLYARFAPDLMRLWEWKHSSSADSEKWRQLQNCYRTLPVVDFSRQLLEKSVKYLQVFPAPCCGWSDLGTPERLQRFLLQQGSQSSFSFVSNSTESASVF